VGMFAGTVTKLWRWPVKGLRGETVRSAEIGPEGMAGDRVLQVFRSGTGDGIWAGGHPRLLEWEAAWPAQCGCADGVGNAPVVYEPGGAAWAADDPGLGAAMAADLGEEALDLRRTDGTNGRILVVFEASLKRLSERVGREIEPERFRPNVMVEADLDPDAEVRLERGTPIRLGGGDFEVHKPCERCVLPSWDPRGRERDKELHRHIVRELGNLFGVYLKTPGTATVRVGDEIGG
jgi:uncharacterized protein YcbX